MRPWIELLTVGLVAVIFVALPKPPGPVWPLASFIAASLTAAAVYVVVRLAHPPLLVGTALLGGLYVVLFQKHRNLWPLGLVHGWLGSLFYPWVLGIDPLGEAIAMVFSG